MRNRDRVLYGCKFRPTVQTTANASLLRRQHNWNAASIGRTDHWDGTGHDRYIFHAAEVIDFVNHHPIPIQDYAGPRRRA